ncbi:MULTISPECIES: hypothetical protein [unclassified Halomonas]|uniref:hypothetical protein n=1 Tax=unclassified Halomonas TaxID=2609666 RepID=UPI00246898F2|nr:MULTISPECIES: hypothetical protein [unclassified Halomonas]
MSAPAFPSFSLAFRPRHARAMRLSVVRRFALIAWRQIRAELARQGVLNAKIRDGGLGR